MNPLILSTVGGIIKKYFMAMYKFIATPGGIVSSVLIIFLSILLYVDTNRDYTSGLITEIIGIIITVGFVQYIFDKNKEIESKREEINKIRRFDIIFKSLIKKYTNAHFFITTPKDKLDGTKPFIKTDFKIADICDLHFFTGDFAFYMDRSACDIYFDIELEMRKHAISMLNNIDFKYNKELCDILINFVESSIFYDTRIAFDEIKNQTYANGKTSIQHARELILNGTAEKIYTEMVNGKKQLNNLIHPYIVLYMQLKEEAKLINLYTNYINKI